MAESDTPRSVLKALRERLFLEPWIAIPEYADLRALIERADFVLAASPAGLKLQEPRYYAITYHGLPASELFEDADEAERHLATRNQQYPDNVEYRKIIPLYALPHSLAGAELQIAESEVQTAHLTSQERDDLQAATAKIMRESAALLIDAHKHTTQGVWRKGMSTHHTVCDLPTGSDYRIAEFHHADDANFCDHAHRLVPMLCQWVIATDRAACEASADARPSDEKAPVSAVAEAVQVLRELVALNDSWYHGELGDDAFADNTAWDRARSLVGAAPGVKE